jgi:phosphatidylethanolamine/phosphatidyl-N-methylethanolamine N-methyltransferase
MSAELKFLREFLKNPTTVGAIAPSSSALASMMLEVTELSSRTTIVEFGPGTGAFTKGINDRLRPDQRYLGIEQNGQFVTLLAQQFPQLTFACGSVEDLPEIAAKFGITSIDAIICGLPWASLPLATQRKTFDAMRALMSKSSVFSTFAYLQGLVLPNARVLRARLHGEFSSVVCSPIVWWNLPPAFIYTCHY